LGKKWRPKRSKKASTGQNPDQPKQASEAAWKPRKKVGNEGVNGPKRTDLRKESKNPESDSRGQKRLHGTVDRRVRRESVKTKQQKKKTSAEQRKISKRVLTEREKPRWDDKRQIRWWRVVGRASRQSRPKTPKKKKQQNPARQE